MNYGKSNLDLDIILFVYITSQIHSNFRDLFMRGHRKIISFMWLHPKVTGDVWFMTSWHHDTDRRDSRLQQSAPANCWGNWMDILECLLCLLAALCSVSPCLGCFPPPPPPPTTTTTTTTSINNCQFRFTKKETKTIDIMKRNEISQVKRLKVPPDQEAPDT